MSKMKEFNNYISGNGICKDSMCGNGMCGNGVCGNGISGNGLSGNGCDLEETNFTRFFQSTIEEIKQTRSV
jgi:hypothetical protein